MFRRKFYKFCSLGLMLFLVLLVGCKGKGDGKKNNPEINFTVSSFENKKEVMANGIDSIILKAIDSNGKDVTDNVQFKYKKTDKEVSLYNNLFTPIEEGTYIIYALKENKISQNTIDIKAKSYTNEDIKTLIIPITSAAVNVGDFFSLPMQAVVIYKDGYKKEVNITWDKAVSTAATGTTTYIGSAANTTLKVEFKLTVNQKEISYIAFSNKVPHPLLSNFFNNVTIALGADMPNDAAKIEFRDENTDLLWDTTTISPERTLSKTVVRVDAEATRVKIVVYNGLNEIIVLTQNVYTLP